MATASHAAPNGPLDVRVGAGSTHSSVSDDVFFFGGESLRSLLPPLPTTLTIAVTAVFPSLFLSVALTPDRPAARAQLRRVHRQMSPTLLSICMYFGIATEYINFPVYCIYTVLL